MSHYLSHQSMKQLGEVKVLATKKKKDSNITDRLYPISNQHGMSMKPRKKLTMFQTLIQKR